ncbi:Uma2 family endonuclease [Achromobacter sp.]|uniref:Uma2 family endonuclease n=1 Tax=Achromobacter sp. TaxID=134375 RepID=UPI00258A2736|nr:Uma2 family endonuclease [Achromobacter sp.]
MSVPHTRMGLEAFLDWENRQPARHEFYRGEVFAMVGARRVHGIVALNVATALKSRLKGKPCMVFIENMKLRVADDALFYPDVFVTCDARDLRTEMVFEHPTLIVEVLSESTQAFDRGAKFAAYRSLASLREYLLIDPDLRTVELFRRNAAGLFELHDHTGLDTLELASLRLALPQAELFEGLDEAAAATLD